MSHIPTLLPKDPPNYTDEERAYLDACLRIAASGPFMTVSIRMWEALRDYLEWKSAGERKP